MPSSVIFRAIANQIADFTPISLGEMDGVKLMDRVDVKYLIPLALMPELLQQLQESYRVLEVEECRLCPYKTLYYDTPNLDLYKAHQNGARNRYKIRARDYVQSDLSFFEIKFKNNKGRTKKTRIRQSQIIPTLGEAQADFLKKTTEKVCPEGLKGVIWVNYHRITLVNKTSAERLTIDLNLTFQQDVQLKQYPELVIAEVKQEKANASPFIELMRQYRLKEGGISKYCFGMISLYHHIKQNTFKQHLRKVSKIIAQHEHLRTNHLATHYREFSVNRQAVG